MKKTSKVVKKFPKFEGGMETMFLQLRNDERGSAILIALIVVLILAGIVGSWLIASINNFKLTRNNMKINKVFYIAEAGIAHSISELYSKYDVDGDGLGTVSSNFAEGSYNVTATFDDDNSKVTLLSTGIYEDIQFQVEVVLKKEVISFSNYAIVSEGDLGFLGNVTIDGNVHSNADIELRGSVDINGDVSAVGSITITGGGPGINGNTNEGAFRVPIPEISIDGLRVLAQTSGTYYPTDQTFTSGSKSGGGWTGDDIVLEDIIFVEGDISISGQVSGSGLIVATGDIRITGDVDLTDGSGVVLVARDDVIIQGNPTVNGLVYASDDIVLHGNVDINGSIIAANNVVGDRGSGNNDLDGFDNGGGPSGIGGNVTVNYVPPISDFLEWMVIYKKQTWRIR